MTPEERVWLTPLESAIDGAVGYADGPPLPDVPPTLHPADALERAVLPALLRPPCVVTFSGGIDSSVALALCVHVARREDLALPIPLTMRFPGRAGTEESHWQELMIRELGVEDWQRIEFADDELDILGPVAQDALQRHGLMAPSRTYTWIPLLARARGGSLVTGWDGDGLFVDWRLRRPAAILRRQLRPAPGEGRRVAWSLAPALLRRSWAQHRDRFGLTWLRPAARRQMTARLARLHAEEPFLWNHHVERWARGRSNLLFGQALDALAADAGAQFVHPLMDRRFAAAVARRGGRLGFGDRNPALRALLGDRVPAALWARRDKAAFDGAYWGRHSKAFVARWTGNGLPSDIVDEEELRRIWTRPLPNFRTTLLLQAAWLSSSGGGDVKQPFNCRLEGREPVGAP